jgi:hypothetical protein
MNLLLKNMGVGEAATSTPIHRFSSWSLPHPCVVRASAIPLAVSGASSGDQHPASLSLAHV